jgi:hypothetical protein
MLCEVRNHPEVMPIAQHGEADSAFQNLRWHNVVAEGSPQRLRSCLLELRPNDLS